MAHRPLIDTHVHFWNPDRLKYSWLRDDELLNRPYEVEDYPAEGTQPEAWVFVECDADPGQSLEEIRFIEEQARRDPRIRAIVAHAALERGHAIERQLEETVRSSPRVRGIRRILQAQTDLPALLLSAAFIEGVRLLGKYDLHFEITVTQSQMACVSEFVECLPQITMVLDHCGKPDIRGGRFEPYRHDIESMARHPNVYCKISGLATESDHANWSEAQIIPYIDLALQAFGPGRLLYGSDWPVCLLATSPSRWLEVVERALSGCSEAELNKIFCGNANQLYRTAVLGA